MLDTLPAIPLFSDLKPDQIEILRSLFEKYNCPNNTEIIKQGDFASFLYILIQGKVTIQFKPYDGSSITLTRLGAGDAFGWSAVVGSTQYTSSILSESQVEAVRVKGDDIRRLIREYPETGKIIVNRLANIVSSRWKNAHTQIQSLIDSSQ
jgi:CRP-like cAMP-binding protein